jgi:hypothetical protein
MGQLSQKSSISGLVYECSFLAPGGRGQNGAAGLCGYRFANTNGAFLFLRSAAGTTHSRFAPVAFLALVTFCAYAPLLAANREP